MKTTEQFFIYQLLATSILAMLFGVSIALRCIVVNGNLFSAFLFACIAVAAYIFMYRPSINALRNMRDNKKGGDR